MKLPAVAIAAAFAGGICSAFVLHCTTLTACASSSWLCLPWPPLHGSYRRFLFATIRFGLRELRHSWCGWRWDPPLV